MFSIDLFLELADEGGIGVGHVVRGWCGTRSPYTGRAGKVSRSEPFRDPVEYEIIEKLCLQSFLSA